MGVTVIMKTVDAGLCCSSSPVRVSGVSWETWKSNLINCLVAYVKPVTAEIPPEDALKTALLHDS